MCYNNARVFAIVTVVLVHGCISDRNSVVPIVGDIGPDVSTRYRYQLTRIYKGETSETFGFNGEILSRYHPRVFATGGLPVVLRMKFNKSETPRSWTILFSIFSLTLIPDVQRWETTFDCSLELVDSTDASSSFELLSILEHGYSILTPTAFFLFQSDASQEGRRVFSETTRYVSSGNELYDPGDIEKLLEKDVRFRRALAYAVAVKLKEFEDAGKVGAMRKGDLVPQMSVPAHNIVRFDRDIGGGYSFVIDMETKPVDTDIAVRTVLHELERSIKDDSRDSSHGIETASTVVAFRDIKIEGLRISGGADVLTIQPLSLSYDPYMRRGKLSVRFYAGQSQEAREWIRRNIETLARDKNIALVTGQRPPEARYYLLGEKVDGNVMEIEFKTE